MSDTYASVLINAVGVRQGIASGWSPEEVGRMAASSASRINELEATLAEAGTALVQDIRIVH